MKYQIMNQKINLFSQVGKKNKNNFLEKTIHRLWQIFFFFGFCLHLNQQYLLSSIINGFGSGGGSSTLKNLDFLEKNLEVFIVECLIRILKYFYDIDVVQNILV